jgi:hypothetical protein
MRSPSSISTRRRERAGRLDNLGGRRPPLRPKPMVLVTFKIKNKPAKPGTPVTPCASSPSGGRALAQIDEELAASLPLTNWAVNQRGLEP